MKQTQPKSHAARALRRTQKVTSRNELETEHIAARFAKTLRGGEIILLDGDLGAGKTAFVRGLAHGLGVRDRITSPTFVLMRVHDADCGYIHHFVHVDAYRVNNASALEAIGLLEWAGKPDTIVAIEWGARAQPIFRGQQVCRVSIALCTRNPNTRSIRIS